MEEKKNVAIISSSLDEASSNIKDSLLKISDWDFLPCGKTGARKCHIFKGFKKCNLRLYEFDSELIHIENPENRIDADYFVFISKHQSSKNIPALSVHSTGNFGKADLGGKEHMLSFAWPDFLFFAFSKLKEKTKGIDIEVVPEATHHGPYSTKPLSFIEIGSDITKWSNKEYGKIVAETVIETIRELFESNIKKRTNIEEKQNMSLKENVAFGIGGNHYCNQFIKYYDKIRFSHICPKYHAKEIDENMLVHALDASVPKANIVLIDWKGLSGEDKKRIFEIAEKIKKQRNIIVMKTKELSKLILDAN